MKRIFVALCCAALGFSVVSAQEPESTIVISDSEVTLVSQDDAPATPVADTPTPTPDSVEAAPVVVESTSEPVIEASAAPVVFGDSAPMVSAPMVQGAMPSQIVSGGEYYPSAAPVQGGYVDSGYVQNSGMNSCCSGCQTAPMTYTAAPATSYAPAPAVSYAAPAAQGCSGCAQAAPMTYAAAPAPAVSYAAPAAEGCNTCGTYASAAPAPAAECCNSRQRPQVIARVRGRVSTMTGRLGSRRNNCCN